MHNMRKWIKVFLVFLSLCVVLMTLLVLLAPRLINSDAVRSGVSAWIAEKTDSSVIYRHVDLHFFPQPHVEVSDMSAGIPGLGSIHAKSVSVHLSLLPLLKGNIDIRKISADEPEVSLDFSGDGAGTDTHSLDSLLSGLAEILSGSVISFENGSIAITVRERPAFVLRGLDVRLTGDSGEILADVRASAGFAESIRATARIGKMDSPERIALAIDGTDLDIGLLREAAYPLMQKSRTILHVFSRLTEGRIPDISLKMTGSAFGDLGGLDDLSVKGRLHAGRIIADEAGLDFRDVSGLCSVSGGIITGTGVSGRMDGLQIGKGSLTLGLEGADAPFHLEADLHMDYAEVPAVLDRFLKERPFPLDRLRAASGPVKGRIVLGERIAMFGKWKQSGHLRFDGKISTFVGPAVSLAFTVGPESVDIPKLIIREGRSDASLKILHSGNSVRVSFAGHLGKKTVDKLIDLPYLPLGFAEGSIEADINRSDILLSTAHGSLAVEKMPLPPDSGVPLFIERIRLKADGSRFVIPAAEAKIHGKPISLKGSAGISPAGVVLDLEASAKHLQWEDFGAFTSGGKKAPAGRVPVTGLVRLKTGSFRYGRQTAGPVQAVITISKGLTKIAVGHATVALGRSRAAVSGTLAIVQDTVDLDMNVKAGILGWEDLKAFLGPAGEQPEGRGAGASAGPRLSGMVRFESDALSFGTRKTGPVRAVASLSPGLIRIDLPDMVVCGIRTPGRIGISGDTMDLNVRFSASKGKLESSFACITQDRSDISGIFELKGAVRGKGKSDGLIRSLEGSIDAGAKDGRIKKSAIILKVYSLLNVSGYLSGNLTDLFREGISYRSITLKADVRNGRVIITEANLDAPSMEIVASGEIDLATEKIDIKMLATPLTTLDVVLGGIPLIGKYVRGSLISLPIMVEGDLKDPEVHYTATSRIGSGLVNLMKSAIEFPFTIIQPEDDGTGQPPSDPR